MSTLFDNFFHLFSCAAEKRSFSCIQRSLFTQKTACTFLHRRPYITSIIELADLDAQLELQVAEDLLDHALHFLSGNFLFRIGQRQGERHALFALAEICAAVDIEQLDLTHQRAGLLDGLFDLAAGGLFIADQCQITLDSSVGTCLLYTSDAADE